MKQKQDGKDERLEGSKKGRERQERKEDGRTRPRWVGSGPGPSCHDRRGSDQVSCEDPARGGPHR